MTRSPWHFCFTNHVFCRFVPALGLDRYTFPSEGVRISWLLAHISALLAAYVALGFSLLASVLYLVQERRLKSKHKPAKTPGGFLWIGCRPRYLERIAMRLLNLVFPV